MSCMYANEAQRTPRSCRTVAEAEAETERGREGTATQMLLQTGYLVAMPMPHVAATPSQTTWRTNENYFGIRRGG